jgi:hypothetical protein
VGELRRLVPAEESTKDGDSGREEPVSLIAAGKRPLPLFLVGDRTSASVRKAPSPTFFSSQWFHGLS